MIVPFLAIALYAPVLLAGWLIGLSTPWMIVLLVWLGVAAIWNALNWIWSLRDAPGYFNGWTIVVTALLALAWPFYGGWDLWSALRRIGR